MKMHWILPLWVFTLALPALLQGAPHQGRPLKAGRELLQEGLIPKMRLELASADLEKLRQNPRVYVTGTVREGATVYTNVSIRLKGGPGSFRPLDDKPAFTLNFARLAPGQTFHGLKKLHLNNSVQDHTYVAEKISRELFDAADVPVPLAGHAWVQLNGRHLGFYVLIEGINKQFLKRHFQDTGGNLYDGHSQSEVTRRMRTNSGENRADREGLRALAAAAQQSDLPTRLTDLEKTLDVDRFLSFLATEVMLCHWDGYAMNRNNFRIYHDRTLGKMVFVPQGVDQVFQRQNTGLFPGMVGLVAKSALEVPELRERYRQRMAELLTNVWQVNVWTNRLYQIGTNVQASLAANDSQAAAGYMNRVAIFSRRMQQRLRALEREVTAPVIEPQFDASGLLALTNWTPKIDLGSPSVRKEPAGQHHAWLYIATEKDAAASWRAKVLLDKGHYRFRGRMRGQGIELISGDAKTGAGLRISRGKFSRELSGDLPWTTVTFDFEVTQDRAPVELVCELRAAKGEVWFDQTSLRLVRQE